MEYEQLLKKMAIKDETFSTFDEIADLEIDDLLKAIDARKFFSNSDPFDFFREPLTDTHYIPKSQLGLRKAFSENFIGIENFLILGTSLRPLCDEAQDLDEITRLFSMQKLASRPNLHSVKILRNMIKDPNPEIALYAAEGLNSIENSFINAIQIIKDAQEKEIGINFFIYLFICDKEEELKSLGKGLILDGTEIEYNPKDIKFIIMTIKMNLDEIKNELSESIEIEYIFNYILGKIYLEFAYLLEGQELIKEFYLQEALNIINLSYLQNRSNLRTRKALGEIHMGLKEYEKAISVFADIFSENKDDLEPLFLMAECCYNLKTYEKVVDIFEQISDKNHEFDETRESCIYQWLL